MPPRESHVGYLPRAPSTYPILFGLAVLAVNLLLLVITTALLIESRQQYEAEAEVAAQNLATLLESSIDDELERIELGLYSIEDEIARETAGGRAIDGATLNAFLARLDKRYRGLDGFHITDARGDVRYGTGLAAHEPINIANQEHFIYLRNHPEVGTMLTRPSISLLTNRWIVRVVRGLHAADGSFIGVVSGVADLEHFARQFDALNIGQHGLINLRHSDDLGIVLRRPAPNGLATIVGSRDTSREFIEALRKNPRHGTLLSISPFDGIERSLSYRRIDKWPLLIQVALATEEFLHPWHQRVRITVIAGGFFLLCSLLLVWYNARFWRTRYAMAQSIAQNERLFHSLAKLSSDWFWEQDADLRFTYASGKLFESFAFPPDLLLGKRREELAAPGQDTQFAELRETLNARLAFYNFEYQLVDGNGNLRAISTNGEPLFDSDGAFLGYRGTGSDITERKNFESRILYMAQHDALTKLPNRVLFYDRLSQAIGQARREGRQFALLYFDLDKFKPVNDNYGHEAGDAVLREVARRLREQLRESDSVARIGGDEFAVLLLKIEKPEDAALVGRKIAALLSAPIALPDSADQARIGVSIGIAIYPTSGVDEDQLLKAADAAMYRAKQIDKAFCYLEAGKPDLCA